MTALLLVREEEALTLLEAAEAYQELMKYRYVFLLGHKGIAETLTLEFK